MNTVAVVWFVDEGEETACSYGTKLIRGLKICANLTKEVCIIQLPKVVFYFSLGIQKNKEQREYCFSKAQCQARLMDQPFTHIHSIL